ncbi:MAG: ATP-grasp domain-containing protein, partial [Xanthomonadales bacterium]|nr:ATP-grasp domain-containing protein [Xanthomonadales bacterium]
TTLRFVAGAAGIPGVRLSLISQDPVERLSPQLRASLASHWRVDNGLDPNQLAQAAKGLAQKLGPPVAMFGPLEHLQVPLAEARAALGIDGLSPEAANNFRDKARMKDVLTDAGVPCARHTLAETAQEAISFAEKTGFPLVAKPPAGAGGKRTFRLNNAEELKTMLGRYPPNRLDPTMLEEFVTGDEFSFDSVMIKGKPLWYSISSYTPSPLEVLENPWIQWTVFLPRDVSGEEFAPIVDAGFKALKALGLSTGLSHMEWFRLKNGNIAISEVGARPPGAQFTSLLSWAHDIDFYRAWPRLMIFGDFDPPPRRYAVGAAYFRGQGRGRVKAIYGLDEAQKRYGHMVVEAKLPRAGQSPSDSYEGDGYVIFRHPESDVVEDALRNVVRLVRVELS